MSRYPTLIVSKKISEEIEEETTVTALDPTCIKEQERNNRLFLRKYQTEGYNPYANFTLFCVPVFIADDW